MSKKQPNQSRTKVSRTPAQFNLETPEGRAEAFMKILRQWNDAPGNDSLITIEQTLRALGIIILNSPKDSVIRRRAMDLREQVIIGTPSRSRKLTSAS